MAYAYKRIKLPDGSLIDEHRLIMQGILCRKLEDDEIVHHKDGNKRNNSPYNLEVMTLSEHSRMHYMNGELSPKMHYHNLTEEEKAVRNAKLRNAMIRENNPNAKFTVEQVKEMASKRAEGVTARAIAREYECCHTTVSRITRQYMPESVITPSVDT